MSAAAPQVETQAVAGTEQLPNRGRVVFGVGLVPVVVPVRVTVIARCECHGGSAVAVPVPDASCRRTQCAPGFVAGVTDNPRFRKVAFLGMRFVKWLGCGLWAGSWYLMYLEVTRWHHVKPSLG